MTPTLARTDTQQALLDAISANPDDDTPRLVYADALDEEAGDLTPRSELIRVQVKLAGLAHPNTHWHLHGRDKCDGCKADALRARERDLLARHEAEWRCPRVCERCGGKGSQLLRAAGVRGERFACEDCHGLRRVGVLGEKEAIYQNNWQWRIPVTWSRGFPRIECPVAWWCEEKYCCLRCGRIDGLDTLCAQCQGRAFKPDYPHARGCWEEQGVLTVRFTDIEPEVCGATYDWNDPRQYRNLPGRPPEVLWDALLACSTKKARVKAQELCYMEFDSPEAAHLALSRACGVWARGLACGRGGAGV